MSGATFTIPGEPQPWRRARSNGRRHFTDARTAAHKQHIGTVARPLFPKPLSGPVRLSVWATFPVPKSLSKRERSARLNRFHTQTPDADNVAKAIMDALNGIAWDDDKQVAEIECRKVWGEIGRTVVSVEAMQEGGNE